MARIRSIKPEFFTSLTIADLSLSARLTFIGLWTYVDDNGVGPADPRLIRAAVWPLEEAPDILQRTREDLQSLQEARLITLYEASGRPLVCVNSWDEHQKVSHPRKPRFLAPHEVPQASDQQSSSSPDDRRSPPEDDASALEDDAPEQGAGSREQGKGIERNSEADASATSSPRLDVERVCQHLAAVIEKGGTKKPPITKTWRKDVRLLLDVDDVTAEQAITAIDWAHADDFWQAHILSPGKLRAKYETLRRQALAQQRKRAPQGPPTASHDDEENPDDLRFG
ncbi:hypothetical protein PV733_31710 [Streptomyces europaeiscabiei]|uniref:hypothetical protein n=1 Tax=Streptomyces europaeiscabiei TaxID=146819 RepID=UPI0029A4D72D|nr:hypothetical protein [Streptomyces europaeiscabiei]MDX3713431.1 hypothetical protein [Streptomyces europaeiscabiei]